MEKNMSNLVFHDTKQELNFYKQQFKYLVALLDDTKLSKKLAKKILGEEHPTKEEIKKVENWIWSIKSGNFYRVPSDYLPIIRKKLPKVYKLGEERKALKDKLLPNRKR
jgi:hypothetical protein